MSAQLSIAYVLTVAMLVICSCLKPPKKECTIRDVQWQIAMIIIFASITYRAAEFFLP